MTELSSIKKITVRNVAEVSVDELKDVLEMYFEQDVPMRADGKLYDWGVAQDQLRYYSNTLSFLYGLHAVLAVAIRHVSKGTEAYINLACKRDMIDDCIAAMSKKYDGLSRCFSMHESEKKRS